MESLYVCHFSNGHIKVGRSIEPMGRIAAHADRVACLGVELVEHFIVECDGPAIGRETNLISRCADAASKRNKNEWFEGLDYPQVCEWAGAEAIAPLSSGDLAAGLWPNCITRLQGMGMSQMQIAAAVGCTQSVISRLSTGVSKPRYELGAALLELAGMTA